MGSSLPESCIGSWHVGLTRQSRPAVVLSRVVCSSTRMARGREWWPTMPESPADTSNKKPRRIIPAGLRSDGFAVGVRLTLGNLLGSGLACSFLGRFLGRFLDYLPRCLLRGCLGGCGRLGCSGNQKAVGSDATALESFDKPERSLSTARP